MGGKEEFRTLLWGSCQIWSINSPPTQVGFREEDLGRLTLGRRRRIKGCFLLEKTTLWWLDEDNDGRVEAQEHAEKLQQHCNNMVNHAEWNTTKCR